MAGSYNHVVTEDGNLQSPESMDQMLENGGDVFEAIEEMYGMIWWLAYNADGDLGADAAGIVEQARQNYQTGLTFAKGNKHKKKYHDH
jgi:hypothetical protein